MQTAQQVEAYRKLKANNQFGNISGYKMSEHELYIYHVKDSKHHITAIHTSGLITEHISDKKVNTRLIPIRVKFSTAQNKWHVSGAGFKRDTVDTSSDYLDKSVKDTAIRKARNFVYMNTATRGQKTPKLLLEAVVEHSDHYMITFKIED